MLTKEEVDHVANLARIKVTEEEYELYAKQLHDILTDIEKINEVDVKDEEMMISAVDIKNRYSNDEIKTMLTKEEIFRNVKNSNGEFIIVPKVVNND